MMGRLGVGVLLVAAVVAHDDQRYDLQEKIPLFVDHLVPDANPSESYPYFLLAFCKPPEPLKYKSQTLGEVLGGSRKIYSKYDVRFGVDVAHEVLCTQTLDKTEIEEMREAVLHHWHSTMYYDEIPLKTYVGEYDSKERVYVYVHHRFNLTYNRDRVIEVQIHPDPSTRVHLPEGADKIELTFSYSARWAETQVQFEDRPANNPREIFEEEIDIQWFSIVNSFVLVVLLTGFVSFISMRMLKKDFQRYAVEDDEDGEGEESGWKLIHADVFRFPGMKSLFCSILGCGIQLLLIFICMLTLSVMGVFYAHGRGTMYATILVIYSLTAVVAGYVSGAFYKKLLGEQWVYNVLLTCTLFAFPVFIIWSFLNSVAWAHGCTAALPFGTIMGLFALYFLVAFPLTLAGAITGKHTGGTINAPCRTKQGRRDIPEAPWWRGKVAHIFVAGFLPFAAIYVELYYVFISLWGHQLYTPYSILYLVFGILLMVTGCITVSLTYLQLSIEDHEWWWRSIFAGGSTAFFMYAYCFYFCIAESHMYGDLQLFFYFGYMGIICYGVFLMLGSVGFFCSLLFVKQIYSSIKID
eukprot:Hpha_TRINITY_DN9155_c0_g1::TRINITY_DN9155_c0_g1_i1::g.94417::m.94417